MLQAYATAQTQQTEKRSSLTRESGTVAAQRRGENLAKYIKVQLDNEGAKDERIRSVLHALQVCVPSRIVPFLLKLRIPPPRLTLEEHLKKYHPGLTFLQAVQVAFQMIFVGGPPTDGLEKSNQLWKARLSPQQRLDAAHMQQEFLA